MVNFVFKTIYKKDGIGAWIKDFQSSDAPQFKGHSKEKRRDQAIAAYLSPNNQSEAEARSGLMMNDDMKPAASAWSS